MGAFDRRVSPTSSLATIRPSGQRSSGSLRSHAEPPSLCQQKPEVEQRRGGALRVGGDGLSLGRPVGRTRREPHEDAETLGTGGGVQGGFADGGVEWGLRQPVCLLHREGWRSVSSWVRSAKAISATSSGRIHWAVRATGRGWSGLQGGSVVARWSRRRGRPTDSGPPHPGPDPRPHQHHAGPQPAEHRQQRFLGRDAGDVPDGRRDHASSSCARARSISLCTSSTPRPP